MIYRLKDDETGFGLKGEGCLNVDTNVLGFIKNKSNIKLYKINGKQYNIN